MRGVLLFGAAAVSFIKICISLFTKNKISAASAALAYYLTMTLFPLLIIIYSFLGESLERTGQLIEFSRSLLPENVLSFIRDFLLYIDSGDKAYMLPLGLWVLVVYASAGLRSVQSSIGSIQGGAEYKGVASYIFSFLYCFVLLDLTCLAVILMLAGPVMIERLTLLLPGIGVLLKLLPLGRAFLAVVLFLFLLGVYHVPKRRQDKYRVLPGAVLVSFTVMLLSPAFSFFMGRSLKYSLVYGALASLILLMLWLYFCAVLIYCGAIFNVALYETKNFGKK